MTKLKNDFSESDRPIVLTGIITNSDPRVYKVLASLGLRVNESTPTRMDMTSTMKNTWDNARDMRVVTSVNHMYNSVDHFTFMATSYGAGQEKPNPAIFARARSRARILAMSRWIQENDRPESGETSVEFTWEDDTVSEGQ